VDGPPGSLNRAHHHPRFRDWEPGSRNFDPDMTADPVQWVGDQLADLDGLLERAGVRGDGATAADAKAVRDRLPEITDAVRRLLQGVKNGELGLPPGGGDDPESVRASWL